MKKLNESYTAKKRAMSIAYAIVLLIIVGVAIAGLTPVLTRKLPNLTTSSTIKHPKGWYESYNAPKEGVKYCKTCKDHEPSPWPNPVPYIDETTTSEDDPCYGNPACLPYIAPTTPPDKIVAFERYCKGNGKCSHPVNCKNNPDHKCRFSPPEGVTKFEVYAIGGGGGSGSAVASNNKGYGWPDGYKKIVGGRNDYDGVSTHFYTSPNSLLGASTSKDQLGYSDRIVGAHFIDMNRNATGGNPYTPAKFVNDPSSDNLYPNKLSNDVKAPKCATGILYTVGDESRRNHILPTEDADSRLAAQSSKQVKRILKELGGFLNENKTYSLGDRNLNYYDRYYLFTKELGVYSYNQNPKYALMPEWVKVTDDEPKYQDVDDEHIFDLSGYTYCKTKKCLKANPENDCFKKDNSGRPVIDEDHNICYINYYMGSGVCKKGNFITSITSKYKTTAAVACSGDGQAGANVSVNDKDGMCDWMKPKVCKYKHTDSLRLGYKVRTNTTQDNCGYPGGVAKAPENNSDLKDKMDGYYCWYRNTKMTVGAETADTNLCSSHYEPVFYNRECKFQVATTDYVTCPCDMTVKLSPTCRKLEDPEINKKCLTKVYEIPVDPNDADNFKNQLESATDSANNDIDNDLYPNITVTITDSEGNEHKYTYAYDPETRGLYPTKDDGITPDVRDEHGKKKTPLVIFGSTEEFTSLSEEDMNNMILTAQDDAMAKIPDGVESSAAYTGNLGIESDGKCTRIGNYHREAFGLHGGKGICGYVIASINKGVDNITVTPKYISGNPPYKSGPSTADARGYSANYSSDGINEGKDKAKTITDMSVQKVHKQAISANYAQACIYDKCATASGGTGGTDGWVGKPACLEGNAENGQAGTDGTVSDGGSFPKSEISSTSKLKYNSSAYVKMNGQDKYELIGVNNGDDVEGTQKRPGIYNFRYIWYMPFVTKHLLFGTSGDTGEELLTTVTLSKGQTLEVSPGKGAALTDYQSGNNGANGGDSTVVNQEAKVNLAARGGKGGVGSQKTDEYVLCHISDLQTINPDLPCYAKTEIINGITTLVSGKKTHYYDTNEHKYKGIQAILPKDAKIGKSLKMSESLKQSNPGAGAMGFGTQSVSDFVCDERRVDKYDQINGSPTKTATVIKSGGSLADNCKGNSRIRYILPNAKDYTSSTGAVIIVW